MLESTRSRFPLRKLFEKLTTQAKKTKGIPGFILANPELSPVKSSVNIGKKYRQAEHEGSKELIPSQVYELYTKANDNFLSLDRAQKEAYDKAQYYEIEYYRVSESLRRQNYEDFSVERRKHYQTSDEIEDYSYAAYRKRTIILRDISREVILKAWKDLTPIERRVLDVAAADKRVDGPRMRKTTAVCEVIENLHNGIHILDEQSYVSSKLEMADILDKYFLNLIDLNSVANDIYGNGFYKFEDKEKAAFGNFALQRTLKQMTGSLLEKILELIPEENTINRGNIISYFRDVIGNSRAFTWGIDGIKLTLSPHIYKPYTNEEWYDGLKKKLEVAPEIAQSIAKACPDIVAVTVYGPLTKAESNYPMFHPHESLQLGAVFNHGDRVSVTKAINVMDKAAELKCISAKAGTSHDILRSTWDCSNLGKIHNYVNDIRSGTGLVENEIEFIAELGSQINRGKPLVVTDEDIFEQTSREIRKQYAQHVQPVFDKVKYLHQHMELGYPTPIEYTK